MIKTSRLLTRPTPARRDAPSPQRGRRRLETGGGTDRASGARWPILWILTNGKPLQDFRSPRISIGTLRISMSRERSLGKGASRRAGVGRVRTAGFFSILLAAKGLFGRGQLAFDHCADHGQPLRCGSFTP